MGFTPQQVDRMSLWQFCAALHGFQIGNGQKERPVAELSDEQLRAMGVEGF